MIKENEVDAQLISILRNDGRRSISDLALDMSVSRATVRARMTRLENEGVIIGYAAVLSTVNRDHPIHAIMSIEVEGKASDVVVDSLRGFPQVLSVYATNGRWDLIAELATHTLEDFDEVLRQIRLLDGILTSETSLLLATKKGIGFSTKERLGGRTTRPNF